ncbi:MAG TPA: regulator [Erysipelotrichaceae bacterium]|nr:regulator [Erysipelotrichaceae bacterium]
MKKVISPEAPAVIGPYSHAYITVNGLVFTSGQIGACPDGSPMPEGIEAQAEQSCRNAGAVLKAAGTDYDHVIKTTCFLADMNDFAAFNSVYEKYFVSRPARSCVAVKTLPAGALCEIEAVAELPGQ